MQSVKRAGLLANRVAALNTTKFMNMNTNQIRMYSMLTQSKFVNNQVFGFNNMRAFSANPPSNGIYIDGISKNVADAEVQEMFGSFEGVQNINLQNQREDVAGRAFINFDTLENAQAAVEKLGGNVTLGGETIDLGYTRARDHKDSK